ncbi:MAG: hypothetical protein ACI9SB_001579 [Candidatus Azotimanducaceae bacterium]|jgi:hypothetical protein
MIETHDMPLMSLLLVRLLADFSLVLDGVATTLPATLG